MTVTHIDKGKTGRTFDTVYHDLQQAIGDAKVAANMLSCVDAHLCDVNAVGFALERQCERAEALCQQMWAFHPDHR